METSSKSHPSIDTLLAVMSTQLDTLLTSVEKIEKKLEAKADLADFIRIEKSIDDHKKDTTIALEKVHDKINSNTTKISLGAGILTALSWAFQHFIK